MWCRNRKSYQEHVSVEAVLEHTVLERWSVAAPIRGWAFTSWYFYAKKEKKKGGWCETVPRHESQLHLMIAKGWSTCKLYCSSIVPPSTRRDHLSHQSQPALLPEHRRWIPAHHPCGYLCLTARKKESKAGYKAWKQHSFFMEARREDLRHPRWNASRHPSFLWIGAPTWHVLHAHANPFPFVFGSFSSESIPALKSKWASCALHVERWKGA